MYSLSDYGRMLGEKTRFGAYRRALERAVRPGAVVIDLGAGPGVFALLAARAGARRVYAVEPDPVVELVTRLARANAVDSVEAIAKLSTGFEPAEKADVLISDLRGVLPTFTEHLPSVIDARRRLLAPAGVMIPRRDFLWAAPISAPDARRRHLGGFALEGLDLSEAARRASHLWTRVELEDSALASDPCRLGELDYLRLESPDFKASATFEVRESMLDGIAVWFDAELDDVERFSNAPCSKLIYGQAFFPFEQPIMALAGDRLELKFAAHYRPEDDYLYRWSGALERDGQRVASFDQSTFHSTSIGIADVASRAPGHIAKLSPEARIDAAIIDLLDGERTLASVAAAIETRFSTRFSDRHEALRRVSSVADRYAAE